MKITPAQRIEGRVRLPGDKSISHRAALIAALATGKSKLTNFSSSQDCASTLACLEQLGVSVVREGSKIQIEGNGFQAASGPLDCGNSGSTLRMLAGVVAGQNFTSTLTGDSSLRARPMERLIAPLEMMGAHIDSQAGRAPLRIEGRNPLKPLVYELPVASAQIKTCVMLAGLQAAGETRIIEKAGATRDHTERLLSWFDAPLEVVAANGLEARACLVHGPANFPGNEVHIPGDFSSATFLIAGAALLPRSELLIEDVGLNPTRIQFLEILTSLGAGVEILEIREECNEPVGTIRVRSRELAATRNIDVDVDGNGDIEVDRLPLTISGQLTVSLIDELPLLAVMGTQLPGGLIIRDAHELRLKETDRIAAVVKNLRAMGARVEESADGLVVAGPVKLKGAVVDSEGDHRIAMAFSIAALLAQGESEIPNSECAAVSFPEFLNCLESIVKR